MIRTEKGMRNKNEGIYNYINYVLLIQKKKTETNGKWLNILIGINYLYLERTIMNHWVNKPNQIKANEARRLNCIIINRFEIMVGRHNLKWHRHMPD